VSTGWVANAPGIIWPGDGWGVDPWTVFWSTPGQNLYDLVYPSLPEFLHWQVSSFSHYDRLIVVIWENIDTLRISSSTLLQSLYTGKPLNLTIPTMGYAIALSTDPTSLITPVTATPRLAAKCQQTLLSLKKSICRLCLLEAILERVYRPTRRCSNTRLRETVFIWPVVKRRSTIACSGV